MPGNLTSSVPRKALYAIFMQLLIACSGGGSGGDTSNNSSTGSSNSADTSPTFPGGASTGGFSLSWTAPISRADGTSLTMGEISGYRILIGQSPGVYPTTVLVNDGTLTTTTITNLYIGNYYVVMTTLDVDGLESAYSPPIIKTAR